MNYVECSDETTWNNTVNEFNGHPLQLWGWGEVKAAHNWSVKRLLVSDGNETVVGGAQLLMRRLPGPLGSLVYAPRGPFCHDSDREEVISALRAFSHERTAFALSLEPDWTSFPDMKGWRRAANTILLPRTVILDLTKSTDELRGSMAKKTRQYIRKSEREALEIEQIDDQAGIRECLSVYGATAKRAAFTLHDDSYYLDIDREMKKGPRIMAARYEGTIVAFLWVIVSDHAAFELYGGVTDEGQRLRANYILKWRMIEWCKANGVARYDLNGLLNDGILTFKQGFSERETRLAGTYDYAFSPLYPVWNRGLPFAKKLIRLIKR